MESGFLDYAKLETSRKHIMKFFSTRKSVIEIISLKMLSSKQPKIDSKKSSQTCIYNSRAIVAT